ncbi:transmembrane 4 L6 family member 19 isoform X1 [Alligator sinensis]|uniref:Transmembrane 4 L6 family member 19 isoform X1 n=1 Tax=Alligator sinensis TaxID=38654 RepID=A0A3Q0HLB0_ALLSI|nr:transmembrane 4 L6 family member 19 isoform X1 [Alligator sinensis]
MGETGCVLTHPNYYKYPPICSISLPFLRKNSKLLQSFYNNLYTAHRGRQRNTNLNQLVTPCIGITLFQFSQVLLAATHITAVGWRCGCFSDCGTWRNLFLSIILSGLALLGSAACFIMAGLGLTNGPLCLSNGSTHNQDGIQHWNYPFSDTSSQDFTSRADNYLFNQSLWTSVCIEPPRIVPWNISLFSLLMIISAVEMVLASLQIINGFFGCLCGFCEGK